MKYGSHIETVFDAPVYEKTKCGEITVHIGNREIYRLDIFTKNGIEKKNIWGYYSEIAKKLFKSFGTGQFEAFLTL